MISFWVCGAPVQKGNHRAVARGGRAMIVDDWCSGLGRRLKAWLRDVVTESLAVAPAAPLTGPVRVSAHFFFTRPKSNRSAYPTSHRIPDGDKLVRAVWDALQVAGRCGGRIIADDCQVVEWAGSKAWADVRGPGCFVMVEALEKDFPSPPKRV